MKCTNKFKFYNTTNKLVNFCDCHGPDPDPINFKRQSLY